MSHTGYYCIDLELDLPPEQEAQRHLQESLMAPQCPEAAWASLHGLSEVIIQEQLALEGLGVPVLLSVGNSLPGPSTGSTVVPPEQPAAPEASLSAPSQPAGNPKCWSHSL